MQLISIQDDSRTAYCTVQIASYFLLLTSCRDQSSGHRLFGPSRYVVVHNIPVRTYSYHIGVGVFFFCKLIRLISFMVSGLYKMDY